MTATTDHHQVSIEADPTLPIIRMTRDFDATAGAADAGPHGSRAVRPLGRARTGWRPEILDWDATTGGRWRYVARRDGVRNTASTGASTRSGWTASCRPSRSTGSPTASPSETLWFEELGDGRTRLHAQSLVDSFESRDQWLASGMETGVDQGYAKLDALVAEIR